MNIEKFIRRGIEQLKKEFGEESIKKAIQFVKDFDVEVPSWVFGPFGGGRFGEYIPPAAARNIYEKIDDISFVYKITGCGKKVMTHILWDFSKDGVEPDIGLVKNVYDYLKEKKLELGMVSPTYFLSGSHKGSFSSYDKNIRKRYINQTIFASEVAKKFGSNVISLWFPDGSLYPGQVDLDENYKLMKESIKEVYKKISDDVFVLIEYKLFEPGTYSTTIPDWGTSYILTKLRKKNAGVLIDIGHHPHGVNVEQIVATLISEGMRCGFHFNTRYAADDDHAVEPNPQMARIFYYLVKGKVISNKVKNKNWFYGLDQASGRENRIEAVIHSIDSLQISLAKASLIDNKILKKFQLEDDIIGANRYFNRCLMLADVRPIVYKARIEKNLPPDPIEEYRKSGYQRKIEKERR